MGIFYTPHDKAVCSGIRFKMRGSPPDFPDRSTDAYFADIIGSNWPFQFPPRVKNDTKGGDWEEKNKVSFEPVAFWTGAQPRKISVEAVYVVTGDDDWGGEKIAKIAHAAKAYFYRSITKVFADGTKGFGPVVELTSLYGAVQEMSTWRMYDVSVEYSETFVAASAPASVTTTVSPITASVFGLSIPTGGVTVSAESTPGAWPLKTTITFNLASYTQIQDEGGKPIMATDSLVKHPTPKWY